MSEQDPILDTHTSPDPASKPLSDPPETYTYYHAGPLFSLGDLTTNVRLSTAVHDLSNGRYQPILPQDLEQRDTSPHSIRDQDIKALLSCDLALFTYDGSELDSGTVIEYMVAKFADIPAVILRTDFRGGGDQGAHQGDPWNLMSSFWPRTVGVVVDGMIEYKTGLAKAMTDGDGSTAADASRLAGELLLQGTAKKIVHALDEVIKKPARLPKELRPSVYQWLALMPGFKAGDDQDNTKFMLDLLQKKEQKGLS